MSTPRTSRIAIEIPGSPTSLVVGRGAGGRMAEVLRGEGVEVRGRRVLVVADANVAVPHAARVGDALVGSDATVSLVSLPALEDAKCMSAVESVWNAALSSRLSRTDLLVAVGGGLVGDLAGFAAATYLRGIDFVQVPTTLLAMVDAAIGGKTGINLTLPGGGLGKNLAGAFWQPKTTVADPDFLATLPLRELRAGLAECAKHAVLAGEESLAALEADATRLAQGDAAALDRLIPASAAIKARIVASDPFERGIRATLNLGHTFGHAIETVPELQLLHGEAVAIGMVAAVRCAAAYDGFGEGSVGNGSLDEAARNALANRIERLLVALGLPVRMPLPVDRNEILRRMGFDKKNEGGGLRLILPRAPGAVVAVRGVPDAAIAAGLAAIEPSPKAR